MESDLGDNIGNGKPTFETAEEKPLSKRQQKLMKRREEWLSQKEERRLERKEKRKEKRRQKVASGVDLGPSRKLLKKNTMKDSKCQVAVAIDLSFDNLMTDKDINKLAQQIQYCYSRNRRATNPLQLHLTSLGDKTQQRLGKVGDYKNWDINISSESYSKLFSPSDIVYLTSDSPNAIETLDSGKLYVIGGLVDHNHHKGICYDLALKGNINHARLPIDEHCKLNTRQVLTINHVFEILLRFTETNSWHDSFHQVIPKRKQAATDEDSSHDIKSVDSSNDSEDGERTTDSEVVRAGAVSGLKDFETSSVPENETFEAGGPIVAEHETCVAGITLDTDSKTILNVVADVATSYTS